MTRNVGEGNGCFSYRAALQTADPPAVLPAIIRGSTLQVKIFKPGLKLNWSLGSQDFEAFKPILLTYNVWRKNKGLKL